MAKGEGTAGRSRAEARGEFRRAAIAGGSLSIDLATRGTFSVSRIVDANPARSTYGGTGARQAAEAAYRQAAGELAFRRQAGQSVPRLTEVRRQIRRAYGLSR